MKIGNIPATVLNNFEFLHSSLDERNSIIQQTSSRISIHKPSKKYLLLSKELGYLNKFTNFIVGEKKSLLFIDKNGEQCSPDISEVINNKKDYHIVYPIPINNIQTIEEIEVVYTNSNLIEDVVLDFEFGKKVGRNIITLQDIDTPLFKVINGCLDKNAKQFWPNKQLLLNSNIQFLLGIIVGYQEESVKFKKNHNSNFLNREILIYGNNNAYIFYTILNLFGVEYRIKWLENSSHTIAIHCIFPAHFIKIFKKLNIKFYTKKNSTYIIKSGFNKIKHLKLYEDQKELQDLAPHIRNINEQVNDGKILLISAEDINFIEIDSDDEMYDFTMNRVDATNYALPFTPVLKNSDGDILTISTTFSKEAIKDSKPFEPNHKDWFRNLNDGTINSYIKDDSLLGLYAATKHLKK